MTTKQLAFLAAVSIPMSMLGCSTNTMEQDASAADGSAGDVSGSDGGVDAFDDMDSGNNDASVDGATRDASARDGGLLDAGTADGLSADTSSIDAGVECRDVDFCGNEWDDNCDGEIDEGCGPCAFDEVVCESGCCAEEVVLAPRRLTSPSAVTDSRGNIYVAWCGRDLSDIGFAFFDAETSTWRTSTGNGYCDRVSGFLEIFRNETTGLLSIVTRANRFLYMYRSDDNGRTWSSLDLPDWSDWSPPSVQGIDVAVDSDDSVHVIQQEMVSGSVPGPLHYGVFSDAWTTERSAGVCSQVPQISLNDDDEPVIACGVVDGGHYDLEVLSRNSVGNGWERHVATDDAANYGIANVQLVNAPDDTLAALYLARDRNGAETTVWRIARGRTGGDWITTDVVVPDASLGMAHLIYDADQAGVVVTARGALFRETMDGWIRSELAERITSLPFVPLLYGDSLLLVHQGPEFPNPLMVRQEAL